MECRYPGSVIAMQTGAETQWNKSDCTKDNRPVGGMQPCRISGLPLFFQHSKQRHQHISRSIVLTTFVNYERFYPALHSPGSCFSSTSAKAGGESHCESSGKSVRAGTNMFHGPAPTVHSGLRMTVLLCWLTRTSAWCENTDHGADKNLSRKAEESNLPGTKRCPPSLLCHSLL